MANKLKNSEAAILDQYGIALKNVEEQPVIASSMAEMGYDTTVIAQGKALYNEAQIVYTRNKVEDDQTKAAYLKFDTTRKELADLYRLHRKKAKIVFKADPLVLRRLDIDNATPKAYPNWIQVVQKFYYELVGDDALKGRLSRLKVSDSEINRGMHLVSQVIDDRANYRRELGESEEMTRLKDVALAEIDRWMSEFYAVARIALDDQPQLLEALAKTVKR